MQSQLEHAITRRQAVRFRYLNDPLGEERVVHPHILFRVSSTRLCVDGFQVAGHSSKGPASLPAWRRFDVELVTGLEVLAERFEPASAYDPDSPLYRDVVARC